ncbi:MAG: hypothetical protein K8R58_11240 [Bacteroidales bacterium]|nr:hypothetical protein [Bacteroidales bacterium]
MKKLHSLSIIILALIISNAVAQSPSHRAPNQNSKKVGDMYLDNEWKYGLLMLNDNTIIGDRLYRYNIYEQKMQYIFENDTLSITNPERIKFLSFDGKTYYYFDYFDNNRRGKGYFEFLAGRNFKLLRRSVANYNYKNIYEDNEVPIDKRYVKTDEYYIKKCDEPAIHIVGTNEAILNLLSDKKTEVVRYIKQKKLNIKNEDDMIAVIEFYNSLYN